MCVLPTYRKEKSDFGEETVSSAKLSTSSKTDVLKAWDFLNDISRSTRGCWSCWATHFVY